MRGGALLVVLGLAGAGAANPPSAPVPATQEIEVLDPGVGSGPAPAAVGLPGPAGGLVVDVPPAVLVHRFYYTGDRSFQAQLLPGGPLIVAVTHPQTLTREYVPLTLPPGAPRVTYTARAIRYDYGPQSVTLSFGACGRPAVTYSQATAVGNRLTTGLANTAATTRDLVQRTGLPAGVRAVGQGTRELLLAGADAVGAAGQRVGGVVRSAPLLNRLTPGRAADTGFKLPTGTDRFTVKD